MSNLSIRPIQETDFERIINYFLNAEEEFLTDMGVKPSKLPEYFSGIFENFRNKSVFIIIKHIIQRFELVLNAFWGRLGVD